MSNEIRFGIIGCGVIGTVHADALQMVKGARLVAVADILPEAAQKIADRRQTAWYQDYHDMLAQPGIDAVTICTPSGMHADHTVDALRAGKHVVTEKPMAIHLADCDRMITAAAETGKQLGVIFQNRFYRDVLRIRLAAQRGSFGRLTVGNAVVRWWRSAEYFQSAQWRGTWALDGGGALMNQSIHYIDLLQWCFGPVERISAHTATLAHSIETEDVATATLRFKSGALGVIEGTTAAYPGFTARLEVHGDQGGGAIDAQELGEYQLAAGVSLPADDDPEMAGAYAPEPGAPWWHGHVPMLQACVDALHAGKPMPIPGAEGRKAVEIILAIYKSGRTGRTVKLPLRQE